MIVRIRRKKIYFDFYVIWGFAGFTDYGFCFEVCWNKKLRVH